MEFQGLILIGVLFLIVAGFGFFINWISKREESKRPEKEAELAKIRTEQELTKWGTLNTQMICPHCQTKGFIRTTLVSLKKGVSGGKATAALLTGGLTMLATGLSRKEKATQAHCENCNNTWIF
jgi:transcription elongation factor Elf1